MLSMFKSLKKSRLSSIYQSYIKLRMFTAILYLKKLRINAVYFHTISIYCTNK